jgi:hypothetical protein
VSLEQLSSRPVFIEGPRDPTLRQLLAYWNEKRGDRRAPSREDIRPEEIVPLLPDVMIWSVDKIGGPYTIRRVGENIANFLGRNHAGSAATDYLSDDAAAVMTHLLTHVATTMIPLFRSGKTSWHPVRSNRDFEVCYLPLSADGVSANMILGGVIFS